MKQECYPLHRDIQFIRKYISEETENYLKCFMFKYICLLRLHNSEHKIFVLLLNKMYG
jgi:hypothetical protein